MTTSVVHDRIVDDDFRAQQTLKLLFDDRIALAYPYFEPVAIEHGNVAAAVIDQPRVLQLADGRRDAFSAHAEQTCEQLLRDRQLVRRRPIQK